MAGETQILYNGTNPFAGLAPTPFVARTEEIISVGERWGMAERLSLIGQLTGGCATFATINAQQNSLIERFSKDYQTIQITESGSIVYTQPYASIQNINFGAANYSYGFIPFTIDVLAYPQELFTGTYGVLDPSHQFNFEEQTDGTVTLQHSIGCKGSNTSAGTSNALENARIFCQTRSGWSSQILPKFIGAPAGTPVLLTIAENINRFTAEYGIVESYRYDTGDAGTGILRYSTTFNSGILEGLSTVEVRGQVDGDKGKGLDVLRTRYTGFNIWGAAQSGYSLAVGNIGATGLNPEYLSSGVNENPLEKRIDFTVAFDDDPRPSISFDYKTSLSTDYLADVSTMNFDGNIQGRGDVKTRWARVSGYYTGLNVFTVCNSGYNQYGLGYPLNPKPQSSGTIWNQYAGEISVNATFDNRQIPPVGFDKLEFNMAYQPAIHKYSSDILIQNANSGYYVTDLGFNRRASLTINGNAQLSLGIAQDAGVAALKTVINNVRAIFTTGTRILLERSSFGMGTAGRSGAITFDTAWSEEELQCTVP